MKLNNRLLAFVGTGAIVTLIILITNTNTTSQSSQKATSNINSPTQAPVDPMADHHGEGAKPDTTIFDSLAGKVAPDFTLESYDGEKFALSNLKGKNVVLFFNEGLMCYPACWNQIVEFGKDKNFASKNALVLNITVDPKKDWKDAVDKMPELTKAITLFDSDKKVATTYGVLTLASSMHPGQFPGHSYVIVDKEGIVRFAKDDPQMAIRNKPLLEEIDKLK